MPEFLINIANEVTQITLELDGFDPNDTRCKTPKVLAFCVEDSTQMLIGLDGLSEGIQVTLNTGEAGIIVGGLALIELNDPLVYGDEVWVEIDTEDCKTKSCSYFAGRISANCVSSIGDRPSGELTGRLGCVEKDLFREVYNGDGGVTVQGVLVQENCIYCNGQLPNCIEVPDEVSEYYNVVSCTDNKVYQVICDDIIAIPNQRLNHPIHGFHYWNGTKQSSSPNYRGSVTIVLGQTLCPALIKTYYRIVACYNQPNAGTIYETDGPLLNDQLVYNPVFGYLRHNGTTTTSNGSYIVTSVIAGQFSCP